jgi:hypothetical protein
MVRVHSQAVARLQQGANAAATTLPKVMLDQRTPSSVRVRAECVINHSFKAAIEIEDVEARVAVGAGRGSFEAGSVMTQSRRRRVNGSNSGRAPAGKGCASSSGKRGKASRG